MPTLTLTAEQAIDELMVKDAHFAPSTLHERHALAALTAGLLPGLGARDPRAARLRERAERANLSLQAWLVDGRAFWAVREPERARRGAGAYLFSASDDAAKSRTVLLQAPHAYYDLGTGWIAAHMYFTQAGPGCRGFFINTNHRYKDGRGPGKPHRDSAADVCHNPYHAFSAATEAAAKQGPVTVVQIHGFAASDDSAAADAAAIVSAGRDDAPTQHARAVAESLAPLLGPGVRLYPDDIDIYGATTNVQGRLLSSLADASFVHIELSASTRSRLKSDRELLTAVAAAVVRAART